MTDARAPVQLLVSVRDAAEARLALAGGAALIDIKEPARGSLGRADANVIAEIAAAVNGQRPVSAALGEWADEVRTIPDTDLTYVKWGLAGCARRPRWRRELTRVMERENRPRPVLVAYADWQCAQAPSVDDVFALACEHPGSVMLVDTHCKEAGGTFNRRPTLLDWLPAAWIEDLCARCRESHVSIALAGSLDLPEIRVLLPARPTWFAVRGAVCAGHDRQATVQVDKVRQLQELLQAQAATTMSAN
jgi:uncharacterized protein (UPF0264 family)